MYNVRHGSGTASASVYNKKTLYCMHCIFHYLFLTYYLSPSRDHRLISKYCNHCRSVSTLSLLCVFVNGHWIQQHDSQWVISLEVDHLLLFLPGQHIDSSSEKRGNNWTNWKTVHCHQLIVWEEHIPLINLMEVKRPNIFYDSIVGRNTAHCRLGKIK